MKQAVIASGGKQYLVHEGQTLKLESMGADAGSTISFDPLAVVDGEATKIGAPTVEGAKVEATVKGDGRLKKVRVEKFKRKVNYHRVIGHRQQYTEVTITKIS